MLSTRRIQKRLRTVEEDEYSNGYKRYKKSKFDSSDDESNVSFSPEPLSDEHHNHDQDRRVVVLNNPATPAMVTPVIDRGLPEENCLDLGYF